MNRQLNRSVVLALLGGALALTGPSYAQERQQLDLAQARALANLNNPSLHAARQRVMEAQGSVIAASRSLQSNPVASFLAGPRFPESVDRSTSTDFEFEVEQLFSTGRPKEHRERVAASGVERAEALEANARRLIDLDVTTSFYVALATALRIDVLQESEALAAALHATAEDRLRFGEGTQLEVDTATIRLARTRRLTGQARAQQQRATIRLVELLGLPMSSSPEIVGELPVPTGIDLTELLGSASAMRPDVNAAASALNAAEAAAELADADAKPDLVLHAAYARDDGDDVVTAGVRLELPIFNNGDGERATARAQIRRLQAEHQAARRGAEAEVRAAFADYEQAVHLLGVFDDALLEAQEGSLQLLELAFAEGAVGYPEVLVVQEQLIAGRQEYIDAQLLAALALAQLRVAAGMPAAAVSTGVN